MGRVIKEHVREICKRNGFDVVYGDTDSTFLVPGENAISIEVLVDIINKSFDDFAKNLGMPTHRFHIELDKVFAPIIVADVAKRYVGFLEKKGKRIFKSVGFEAVRRDTAKITEDMQETIFKIVLAGETKADVMSYVNARKEDIKNGKYPLKDLMLPKGFSKAFDKFRVDSPWVRGARYSNDNLGTSFDQFSDVGIFYIKSAPEGKPYTNVVAIDNETEHILKDFVIDWPTQIDKLIDSKVQNIIDMLGWQDTKQRTLGDF
jgi:DNA polymerase elongation subunit (family B)